MAVKSISVGRSSKILVTALIAVPDVAATGIAIAARSPPPSPQSMKKESSAESACFLVKFRVCVGISSEYCLFRLCARDVSYHLRFFDVTFCQEAGSILVIEVTSMWGNGALLGGFSL